MKKLKLTLGIALGYEYGFSDHLTTFIQTFETKEKKFTRIGFGKMKWEE